MPNKAKLVTRSETTTSVVADTIPKSNTLTHAELDSNLLNLRDATFGVAGDDSATIDVGMGNTIKVAGGNNISTAATGQTITITGSKNIDVNEISSGDSSAIQINDAVNISGATTINNNLAVTGDITTADSLQFDTAAGEAVATGKLYYSSAYGTLAHGLGDGTEIIDGIDLVTYVTNAEATTLTKGEVVYIFGASGDRPSVKRADNSGDPTSSKTLGIVKNNITAGSAGYVVTQGIITGLNTATYTAGDVLWLGTSGAFTATKPTHPAHLVFVGVVLRANAGNGLVYVKPQNGYELDELHDVSVGTAVANDVLKYDGSAWVNTPGGELIYNGNSITAASNADIDLTAGGTGNINLNADTIRLGDSGANATLTTNGAGDIIINTNSGTNSGNITIEDAANGNIKIVPNGTGNVELGSEVETTTNFPSAMTSTSYDPTSTRVRGAIRAYSNLTIAPYTSTDDSILGNVDYTALKTNGGTFTSTNTRTIGSEHTLVYDNNGSDCSGLTTSAVAVRGSRSQVYVKNSAGGTKTTPIAIANSTFVQVDPAHGGTLTVQGVYPNAASATLSVNTGETTTVTDYRGFADIGLSTAGTGTTGTNHVVTNYYGFHTGVNGSFGSGQVITNRPYAFFTANALWRSRVGFLDQFRLIGLAATHSSGGNYNIDLSTSGNCFHVITLTSNITGFTFTNAPAVNNGSVMVRLLFLQDGTGGRTISFTAGGSEIFLFKNGIKTLTDSTAAPEGLVADIFTRYDGTNTRYYWNIDNGEYVL